MHEGRLGFVPALLEVPIVLEDPANRPLLPRQDREQIQHKHRVPKPLSVIAAARGDPILRQRRIRPMQFAEHTIGVRVGGEPQDFGIVAAEERL